MPIYVYVCPSCHQQFDMRSPVGQEEARCPNCGQPAKRSHQISRVAVVFKGIGWGKDKE
jgi:putative FmdB family regulatory protein